MAGFVVAGGGEIPRPVCRIARSLTSAAQSASFHGSFGAVAEEGKAGKLGHCAGSPLVCESTSVAPHNPCASLTNPEERQFSRSLSTVLWELSSRERERETGLPLCRAFGVLGVLTGVGFWKALEVRARKRGLFSVGGGGLWEAFLRWA